MVPQVTLKPAYRIAEFCAAFGIGRSKAYEEIKEGRLKPLKVGKRTLITAAHALAWLELHGATEPKDAFR